MLEYLIVSSTAWWTLEESLNKRLPSDETLSDFDAAQEKGEAGLKSILRNYGVEGSDWEVPDHYHRCAVLYCYIYSTRLVCDEVLQQIAAIVPQDRFPWYAQCECYHDKSSHMLGLLIIRNGECFVDAEDDLAFHLAKETSRYTTSEVWMKRIMSLIVGFPRRVARRYSSLRQSRTLDS